MHVSFILKKFILSLKSIESLILKYQFYYEWISILFFSKCRIIHLIKVYIILYTVIWKFIQIIQDNRDTIITRSLLNISNKHIKKNTHKFFNSFISLLIQRFYYLEVFLILSTNMLIKTQIVSGRIEIQRLVLRTSRPFHYRVQSGSTTELPWKCSHRTGSAGSRPFSFTPREIVMTALCKVAAFQERKFQSFDCSSWFTFAPTYVLHLIKLFKLIVHC